MTRYGIPSLGFTMEN